MTQTTAKKAVILLSGGLDSATCALFYSQRSFNVAAVFVDYGQLAAERERVAASRAAAYLSIPLKVIEVRGNPRPKPKEISGRNAFLVYAGLLAYPEPRGLLALGIHAGTRYYDCSPAFLDHMQRIVEGYTSGRLVLAAPFLDWSKLDIWQFARASSFPIGLTYSCELGLNQPCGKCSSCSDLEALHAWSNVHDSA